MVFPVRMWELDHKESWVWKNWCFWTVVLEKTLESPLDCKEIQPVHPKGNQSWIFIGRTDAEAETPILWPPAVKNWLIWKDPDSRKDWRQGEEGDDRGWDGWMASPTQWTWAWVNSRSSRWTGKPGVLQPMGSQRTGHDWATELNWVSLTGPDNPFLCHSFCYYLKWVYDNESFTIENTLNCSYEGLGEEISDLHSIGAIRG